MIDPVPVYRNLKWTWSFRGLTLVHLGGPLLAAILTLMICVLTGWSVFLAFGVFGAGTAGVAILQYRKPPTYLEDLVTGLMTPRYYSHAIDDNETWPFPVTSEELRRR